MPLMTTAHLPDDMRYDPDTTIRGSGLTIECHHGDPRCPVCIRAAVARLAATPNSAR